MNSGFNLLTEISTKSKFPLSTASMASSGRIELTKLKISQKYFSSVKITSRQ
ncbi:hypothetical protein KF282_2012 [Lactococcus lactis subsp. lactis]|uniref:Uncharacterized protein n=1 Tax=Lactococcus lactis subsp. lactis TaxID=1360 RepID=A0A0V8CNR1_LACLL|nr:hypothetical protein KF282_2012 [Lactococcus lactis subsp. lactis]